MALLEELSGLFGDVRVVRVVSDVRAEAGAVLGFPPPFGKFYEP
jgi:hypothetical protein